MIYLGNASSPTIREAMKRGRLGMLCTPAEGRSPDGYPIWAADNGCYSSGYPGDAAYLNWLNRHRRHAWRCLFATAPDVVGDAAATLVRSSPFLAAIRAMGYKAAFVAQDGIAVTSVPWDQFDVLFLGGTDIFKLGPEAFHMAKCAQQLGKVLHCGRVNSGKRLRYAYDLGCASADGTFLAWGPDMNLPRVNAWYVQQNIPRSRRRVVLRRGVDASGILNE